MRRGRKGKGSNSKAISQSESAIIEKGAGDAKEVRAGKKIAGGAFRH